MELNFTLLVIPAFIALGYILKSYWKSLQKKREQENRAHSELMSMVCKSANEGLIQLHDFKINDLSRIKAETSIQLNSCIYRYNTAANQKIATIMDDDFYKKAAYACLPSKKWKAEFQDSIAEVESEIIDQRALGRELEKIIKDADNKIRRQLLIILNSIQVDEQSLSSETRVILNKYKNNPNKMIQLIGKNSELTTILKLNLKRDAVIGLSLIGSAVVLHIASSALNIKTVAALSGGVMKDIFGSEFLKQATIAISDWLIQEVGEQAVSEVLEAFAVAATGLGIPFTIYKIIKYGRVGYRLFIEKEPLERMRKSVRENMTEVLNNVEDSIEESMNKQIDTWCIDIEFQLRKIIKESKFHEIRLRGDIKHIEPKISFS